MKKVINRAYADSCGDIPKNFPFDGEKLCKRGHVIKLISSRYYNFLDDYTVSLLLGDIDCSQCSLHEFRYEKLRLLFRNALRHSLMEDVHFDVLACTIRELKFDLQKRFEKGMTWENYGKEWHIDHIRPLASFDLSQDKQVFEAMHYTNLQPLWAEENMKKGTQFIGEWYKSEDEQGGGYHETKMEWNQKKKFMV